MTTLNEYALVHRHWVNIFLHILSVPFFVAGTLIGLLKLLSGNWVGAAASLSIVIMAFALQDIGHGLEENKPAPFLGPADMAGRIFAEQFYRFWIFLVLKIQGLV